MSENSRSQIIFQTDIFQKLSLGAPDGGTAVLKHARLTLYRSTAVRVQALKYCCLPRQQLIYLSTFINVSWQLTFVLLGKLSNGLQYHHVQGEYYYTHCIFFTMAGLAQWVECLMNVMYSLLILVALGGSF